MHVLSGKPRATLQAVSTAQWKGTRLIVYVSGNALVVLDGPHHILQTIYHDDIALLDSVAVDEATGKIATSAGANIYVWKPYGHDDGLLKWSLECSFDTNDDQSSPNTLSWGASEELLVGSAELRLYQTELHGKLIWSQSLSNPVVTAQFSPNSALIATRSVYDRIVKIWRRLSFGSEDIEFDFSYLAHPTAVTGIQWRKTHQGEHSVEHILYTTCADNKVRIWTASDPHGLQILQLWAEIDLQESIQPRNPQSDDRLSTRLVFFIDSADFQNAIKHVKKDIEDKPVLEHLVEIAELSPEVCVVLDDNGHMCAWGLQNVGGKVRNPSDIFNIAYVENFDIFSPHARATESENITVLNFSSSNVASYSILLHHFDGRIVWLEGTMLDFFDPSLRSRRLHSNSLWTGHEGAIKKIVRTVGGRAIVSRTNDNDGLIWKQMENQADMALTRCSAFSSHEHVHRTCLLMGGKFMVNLHPTSVSLWNTSDYRAEMVDSCEYKTDGKPLCLIQLPSPVAGMTSRYLATITSTMKGIVWVARLPQNEKVNGTLESVRPSIKQFCTFDLGDDRDLSYVLPIDPAGSRPPIGGFLDTFAKDIALSYTETGVIHTWAAQVKPESGSIGWLATANIATGINSPTLASGSSIRKIALVDSARNGLTIWDTRSSQLEYDKDFGEGYTIQDLDWTSTPDDQSILAVGFPHRVMILAQIRYDYLDRGPAWAPIREIYIRESTPHPIGDSTWLGSGSLVIGAGNQLFAYGKLITTSDEMVSDLAIPTHSHASLNLFDVVSLLNGPLPIFHPQLLSQCILAGKLHQVENVILKLNKELKFFSDGESLDSFLSIPAEQFFVERQVLSSAGRKSLHSSLADIAEEVEVEAITEDLAATLTENLSKKAVPYLSSREQFHLADLIECMATAEKHKQSMDENAMRFLLFFRQHVLQRSQIKREQQAISWREIAWAFHSGSQDILVDLVSRHFQGRMRWEHAKESGIFMWMTDINALRAQFEVVARNEYTKTDEKNPIDCSLYYLALKKKNVLLGLWRMAAWNREQSSTQKLLSNNFSEPRWKTAALKNAYALLGKRRFEYAAAFFLLAGNLRDAVNVCMNQMADVQLAIAVARVYDGDDGPVLKELIEERVLPHAAAEGNRWMATWAFWMLGRRDMAVRALITPVYTLLDSPGTPGQHAESFLATDPALVVLYKHLRDKTLQTLKGASKISPRAEWEFVIQIARLYDRMGCDILALDLVRNWEFLKLPPAHEKSVIDVPNPRLLLRRRSSLVVADMQIPPSPTSTMKNNALKSPLPTVFVEPEANSLLDSFGF